jgi:hypothetical protein
MYSVRTDILYYHLEKFKLFLSENNLSDLLLGGYENRDPSWYTQKFICYAYSAANVEICETLSFLLLKHGTLDAAFREFNNKR